MVPMQDAQELPRNTQKSAASAPPAAASSEQGPCSLNERALQEEVGLELSRLPRQPGAGVQGRGGVIISLS